MEYGNFSTSYRVHSKLRKIWLSGATIFSLKGWNAEGRHGTGEKGTHSHIFGTDSSLQSASLPKNKLSTIELFFLTGSLGMPTSGLSRFTRSITKTRFSGFD